MLPPEGGGVAVESGGVVDDGGVDGVLGTALGDVGAVSGAAVGEFGVTSVPGCVAPGVVAAPGVVVVVPGL
jgi:hypothetical protein